MTQYLIDARGTWSRWPSEGLRRRLGHPHIEIDIPGHAARNLGYVWLAIDAGVTLLQFRAGMVSRATVAALQSYLAKAVAEGPVALVYYASGWMEEAFLTAVPLFARFEQLATLAEPRHRDKIIARSVLAEASAGRMAPRGLPDPLGDLFGLWRAQGGLFDSRVADFLSRSGLADRTMRAAPNARQRLTVQQSGQGFTIYDTYPMQRGVGQDLADQPDADYGRWVEGCYRSLLQSGAPLADDVDAIIEQPGFDARRRRYRRLALRWRQPDGGVLITGSSLLRQDISIPLDQAEPARAGAA